MNCSREVWCLSIVTFQRPRELQACLRAVQAMRPIAELDLRVHVINNESTSAPITLPEGPFEVRLFNEVERGIPFARNRAIEEAIALKAERLIFIDDDTCPATDWLESAFHFVGVHSQAQVIQGKTRIKFEKRMPWYLHSSLFDRKRIPNRNMILRMADTNNLIISIRLISDMGVRFDPIFSPLGGEDTDFVEQLRNSGIPVYFAKSVVAEETYSASRVSLGWLLRRRLRNGTSAVLRDRLRRGVWGALGANLARIFYYFLKSPLNLRFRPSSLTALVLSWAEIVGLTVGLMGLQFNEYQREGRGGEVTRKKENPQPLV